MTLVADPLGHDTPDKQGVNCLSPWSLSHIAWWKSEEDCNCVRWSFKDYVSTWIIMKSVKTIMVTVFKTIYSYYTCIVLKIMFFLIILALFWRWLFVLKVALFWYFDISNELCFESALKLHTWKRFEDRQIKWVLEMTFRRLKSYIMLVIFSY